MFTTWYNQDMGLTLCYIGGRVWVAWERLSYRYANVPTDGVHTGPDPSARHEWDRQVR